MNILIAGASGFIGRSLVDALQPTHHLTVLGRDLSTLQRYFSEPIQFATWDTLSTLDANSYDAVINLSGHNIAASRWNSAIKKELISSRINAISALTDWLIAQKAKPHFMSANAVGIYGLQANGDINAFDEDSRINVEHPSDFLSEIGIRWQEALQPAIDDGIRVTTLRFGVVLKKGEGMLKKLGLSFYVGLGAIVGDGQQVISWVHIDDVVGAIRFLLEKPALTGPFNITSPNPVCQSAFVRTLSKILHRPLFLKMPAFIVRVLFGEMGECLLLKGQRVLPKRLTDAGYRFIHPTLIDALAHEFGKN